MKARYSKREDWSVLDRIVNPDDPALVLALQEMPGLDAVTKCFPPEDRIFVENSFKRLRQDEFITEDGIPSAEGIDFCKYLQEHLARYSNGIPLRADWKGGDPQEFLRRNPQWFSFAGSANKRAYKAVANCFAILANRVFDVSRQDLSVVPVNDEWKQRYRGWVSAAFHKSEQALWMPVVPFAFQSFGIREVDVVWFKPKQTPLRFALQLPVYAFLRQRYPKGEWLVRKHGLRLVLKDQEPLEMIPFGYRAQTGNCLYEGIVALIAAVNTGDVAPPEFGE